MNFRKTEYPEQVVLAGFGFLSRAVSENLDDLGTHCNIEDGNASNEDYSDNSDDKSEESGV